MDPSDRTGGGDGVAALLRAQARLADRLEGIADGLPNLDAETCRVVARELPPMLAHIHDLEELYVLEPLSARVPKDSVLAPVIGRMRNEHIEDLDAAGELAEAMLRFAHRPSAVDSDRLGYQLRSLFVALRRHHALDQELLLPEAYARLTPGERVRLAAALRRDGIVVATDEARGAEE